MPVLKVKDLTVSYAYEEVIRNINFSVSKGEILGIVGESGSGKSTILRTIQKFLPHDGRVEKGHIFFKEQEITQMNLGEFRKLRGKEIGIIFQEPGSTMNPYRKIGSQFIDILRYHKKLSKKEALEYAVYIMEKMRLREPKKLLEKYPFELSGGMKQRMSIAMAISLKPDLILADEPTSNLDATVQKKIIEEFLDLREEFNTSIVIVTHNLALAKYVSDNILVLYEGAVVEYGRGSEVISQPKHKYTRSLIQNMPKIKDECQREEMKII